MIVSISQPAYLPWLGYFDRLLKSDLHIVLDHVNIDASSKTKFANRNKVRTADGWCWLTVPLQSKGRHGNMLLNEVEISSDSGWRQKHWGTLRACYSRSAYFAAHQAFFEGVYSRDWAKLCELTDFTTQYLRTAVGAKCPTLRSSAMGVPGEKAELILNLCRTVGATAYLSGPFGRDYLNADDFAAAGIQLVFHDYPHPTYEQTFPGFEPYMSVVDLLFQCGPSSGSILQGTVAVPV